MVGCTAHKSVQILYLFIPKYPILGFTMDWYLTLRMWPHPPTSYPLALCWFIDIVYHSAVWPSAPWSIFSSVRCRCRFCALPAPKYLDYAIFFLNLLNLVLILNCEFREKVLEGKVSISLHLFWLLSNIFKELHTFKCNRGHESAGPAGSFTLSRAEVRRPAATWTHWTLKLSTNLREFLQWPEKALTRASSLFNAPARAFTIENIRMLGGFLIAKTLLGAFSVKLCEGSLTALLDTRHLFMSRYNIMEIEKPAVSSRPRIMSELHSSGQTRQKWV